MWIFFVVTILANGDVYKERYQFQTKAACEKVQEFQEFQHLDLGGFIVTKCKKEKE